MHNDLNARIRAGIDDYLERKGTYINGKQAGLSTRVRATIDDYREREKALKKLEEALGRDEDFWPLGQSINSMIWWQAEEWRDFFYDRYDFDIQSWQAEDPTDWPSLPQGRNPRVTDEIVKCALAYTYWSSVWTWMLAMQKTAFELHIDPGWAICVMFTAIHRYSMLRSDSELAAWGQVYSKLPPSLREEVLLGEAGWVGSQVNLVVNKRLRAALSGWSKPPLENLAQELPGAILAASAEYEDAAEDRGSYVTQITRVLEDLGSERAGRPRKLTSLSSGAAPDSLEDENVSEIERTDTLDTLERAAKLSPQQAEVWRRVRQDKSIAEIAAELTITENQVSVQKNNAIKKLSEARETIELS
jgi:DNA-binding CsgD family transcriptional regulator